MMEKFTREIEEGAMMEKITKRDKGRCERARKRESWGEETLSLLSAHM